MDAAAMNQYLLPFLDAVVAGVHQHPPRSGKSASVRAGWRPLARATTMDYQYRGTGRRLLRSNMLYAPPADVRTRVSEPVALTDWTVGARREVRVAAAACPRG